MFDSISSADTITSDTHKVFPAVVPSFLDYPRVAAVVRMGAAGYVQLAKAQARVYVANLRAVENNTHAVFTKSEAKAVMALLDFERDNKGNNALTIGNTLMYGTSDSKTVKRIKEALSSGACKDVPTALAEGRGKPVKTGNEKVSAAYIVRANGERIPLTDAQYAAVLAALKLNEPSTF